MGGPGGPCPRRSGRRAAELALTLISAGVLLAAPTPAVSLDGLLAPPPSAGYVADTEANGTRLGSFDAAEYAGYLAGSNDSKLTTTLSQDGFEGGFGASWTEQTTGRGLVELVVAFAGGKGARSWLNTAEALARENDHYNGSLTVFGIGQYYGVRYADASEPAYADVVSFTKGNDFFTVGFISNADDLGAAAATQAKKQFDFAPDDSIPPALWPENLRRLAGGIDALKLAAVAALTIVVLGFLASTALFFYVRREALAPADATLTVDGESHPPDG